MTVGCKERDGAPEDTQEVSHVGPAAQSTLASTSCLVSWGSLHPVETAGVPVAPGVSAWNVLCLWGVAAGRECWSLGLGTSPVCNECLPLNVLFALKVSLETLHIILNSPLALS